MFLIECYLALIKQLHFDVVLQNMDVCLLSYSVMKFILSQHFSIVLFAIISSTSWSKNDYERSSKQMFTFFPFQSGSLKFSFFLKKNKRGYFHIQSWRKALVVDIVFFHFRPFSRFRTFSIPIM